jgi:MFS family permease
LCNARGAVKRNRALPEDDHIVTRTSADILRPFRRTSARPTTGDAEQARRIRRNQRGLDWLSFFIADVETGFGPFLAMYLATQHWTQGEIGLLLTVGGVAGMVSQIPGGALVDAVASKRRLVWAALGMIAVGALIFAFWPSLPLTFLAEMLHGAASGILKPALGAIGLGLVGHRAFSGRLGRNQRFNSFGNALTAGLMGLVGHLISLRMIFVAAVGLCLPASFATTLIHSSDIDYARARSAGSRENPRQAARLRDLGRNRALLVFIACIGLFQLANASIVVLASERLGLQDGSHPALVTSAMVLVPQIVTALIAGWVARRADSWGRKPLLLAGFAFLPARAALFMLAPGPWFAVAIQGLDGLTASIIGVLSPLVIADVVRGSGRYNLAQGLAGAAIGIGAALSTVGFGYLAEICGFAVAFITIAVAGLLGLAAVFWLLPETRPGADLPAHL